MERKLRFYTGPVGVHEFADKMREAGVRVLVEGTECVWVLADGEDDLGARLGVLDVLREAHGTDFGLSAIPGR